MWHSVVHSMSVRKCTWMSDYIRQCRTHYDAMFNTIRQCTTMLDKNDYTTVFLSHRKVLLEKLFFNSQHYLRKPKTHCENSDNLRQPTKVQYFEVAPCQTLKLYVGEQHKTSHDRMHNWYTTTAWDVWHSTFHIVISLKYANIFVAGYKYEVGYLCKRMRICTT